MTQLPTVISYNRALKLAAKIVEGEIYKEHYRQWPTVGDGNRSKDSDIVKHCDALAAAIRGFKI